jgi:hypothetical protein
MEIEQAVGPGAGDDEFVEIGFEGENDAREGDLAGERGLHLRSSMLGPITFL